MADKSSGILQKMDKNTLSTLFLYIIAITALVLAAYSTERVRNQSNSSSTNAAAFSAPRHNNFTFHGGKNYHVTDRFCAITPAAKVAVPNGSGSQTHRFKVKHDGFLKSLSSQLCGPTLSEHSISKINSAMVMVYMSSPYYSGLENTYMAMFLSGKTAYDEYYKAGYDFWSDNKEAYCYSWVVAKNWASSSYDSGKWDMSQLWKPSWAYANGWPSDLPMSPDYTPSISILMSKTNCVCPFSAQQLKDNGRVTATGQAVGNIESVLTFTQAQGLEASGVIISGGYTNKFPFTGFFDKYTGYGSGGGGTNPSTFGNENLSRSEQRLEIEPLVANEIFEPSLTGGSAPRLPATKGSHAGTYTYTGWMDSTSCSYYSDASEQYEALCNCGDYTGFYGVKDLPTTGVPVNCSVLISLLDSHTGSHSQIHTYHITSSTLDGLNDYCASLNYPVSKGAVLVTHMMPYYDMDLLTYVLLPASMTTSVAFTSDSSKSPAVSSKAKSSAFGSSESTTYTGSTGSPFDNYKAKNYDSLLSLSYNFAKKTHHSLPTSCSLM